MIHLVSDNRFIWAPNRLFNTTGCDRHLLYIRLRYGHVDDMLLILFFR